MRKKNIAFRLNLNKIVRFAFEYRNYSHVMQFQNNEANSIINTYTHTLTRVKSQQSISLSFSPSILRLLFSCHRSRPIVSFVYLSASNGDGKLALSNVRAIEMVTHTTSTTSCGKKENEKCRSKLQSHEQEHEISPHLTVNHSGANIL